MPASLEERISRIEEEFDELKRQVVDLKPVPKDWRSTVGAMSDDEVSRSAEKLAREWREQMNQQKY